MIKFAYTILYVENVLKSMEFYQRAFGFSEKMLAPDNSYGEVMSGETTLSFAQLSLAKSNLKDGFIESDLNTSGFGRSCARGRTQNQALGSIGGLFEGFGWIFDRGL
jgi:hypothetical protein